MTRLSEAEEMTIIALGDEIDRLLDEREEIDKTIAEYRSRLQRLRRRQRKVIDENKNSAAPSVVIRRPSEEVRQRRSQRNAFNNRKPWTREDLRQLEENPEIPAHVMAARLGRTLIAIKQKKHELKVEVPF